MLLFDFRLERKVELRARFAHAREGVYSIPKPYASQYLQKMLIFCRLPPYSPEHQGNKQHPAAVAPLVLSRANEHWETYSIGNTVVGMPWAVAGVNTSRPRARAGGEANRHPRIPPRDGCREFRNPQTGRTSVHANHNGALSPAASRCKRSKPQPCTQAIARGIPARLLPIARHPVRGLDTSNPIGLES